MLPSDFIKLGETFEINTGEVITRTKLQDILQDGRIVVYQPTYRMAPVHFDNDTPVRFTFNRMNGMCTFLAIQDEKIKTNNMDLCVFKIITEPKMIQRRSSFRLPIVLNAKVIIPDDKDPEISNEANAKTINLSERGVSFTCFAKLECSKEYVMRIRLEQSIVMVLTAEILRREEPVIKNDPFIYAAQFTQMHNKDQMYICRFIMKRQILDRKLKREL